MDSQLNKQKKIIDINIFYKMIFIYKALEDDWTVSKINDKQYQFKKKKNKNLDYNNEDFVANFVKKCSNIDDNDLNNIFKSSILKIN